MIDKKIEHLLNLETQRFIVCGGLQGAGKSTTVDEFEKVGYKVVCPDRIRVELAKKAKGNEDKLEGELVEVLQKYSMIAWQIAEKRVKEYLSKGDSVIFDAVNSTVKDRKQFIQWSKETNVPVIGIYVECPLELALERNLKRSKTITGYNTAGEPVYGRYVPAHIIELRWISQILPTVQEGFKEVYVLHQGLDNKIVDVPKVTFEKLKNSTSIKQTIEDNKDLFKKVIPSFMACWDIDQENKWHNLKLHDHMIEAAEYLKNEELELFVAGLLHDIGKAVVKKKYGKMIIEKGEMKVGDKIELKLSSDPKFIIARKLTMSGSFEELITEKFVERDSNAHYYEHEKVGAIMARRELVSLGFDEAFAQRVYEYVLYHMDLPYEKYNEKTLEKFLDRVGKHNFERMIKMKKADRNASNNNDLQLYKENFNKIEEFIKKQTN